MDDHAERTVNGKSNAIDQAVRDLNGMDGEGSDLDSLMGANLPKVSIVEQSVLVEFVFDVGERELSTPHRNIQFGQNPGERANVVFVPVGENDAANALAILGKVSN